ncbi:MAG: MlaD family protein [Desulfobacterales bacterium]|jgi:paraquat-inducible protein B|nr:MlaD family protein [Desulfobacterales bacterium]
MSEPHSSDPGNAEAPVAAVASLKRRFSLVWLVPVVAALIGGWLVVKALTEKGPEIAISFKTAEGLEVGKTKVRFKDVEIGQVTAITFGNDIKHVIVKAQLVKEAERFLSENTRFWVVRARVSASAIYGLGTVFSGAYIDLDPGKPGKPAQRFVGLEEPPVVTTGLPGRHFILESERRASIEVGAPIYYRQIKVGEVVAYSLNEDGSKVVAKIFVHAPYHAFVSQRSRFWSASGVDLKMDASGLKVYTESLVTILVGGIAFDSFPSSLAPDAQAPEEAVFTLYPNFQAAQAREYTKTNYFVLLFEESVRGLSPGAPVEFRGIPIGHVVDIKSELDFKMNKIKIPVIVAAEPERISIAGKLPEGVTRENLTDYFIEKGLRAQIRTGNLLTGQNYVALDFFPNAKPAALVREGRYGYAEFPTTPTQLEEIGTKVSQLVAKLDKIPVDEIGQNLNATIKGARRVVASPELLETVTSLNAAVKELQLLTAELRTRTAPELTAAVEQARKSLAAAESTLGADAPLQNRLTTALEELAGAARALRVLADYLERHPESALFGKGKPE